MLTMILVSNDTGDGGSRGGEARGEKGVAWEMACGTCARV